MRIGLEVSSPERGDTTMTDHLGERYEGVAVSHGVNTDETGLVRPAGLSMLKDRFEELEAVEMGEKIGLTTAGYAVYRCVTNGRIGYYNIRIRHDGAHPGGYKYRDAFEKDRPKPHDGFGDGWIVSPE